MSISGHITPFLPEEPQSLVALSRAHFTTAESTVSGPSLLRILKPNEDLSRDEFFDLAPEGWKELAEKAPTLEQEGILLVKELGKGGQGAVYLGWDNQQQCPVAVKFEQSFDLAGRLPHEGALLSSLALKNVPSVFGTFDGETGHYLATTAYLDSQALQNGELAGAQTLSDKLKQPSGLARGHRRELLLHAFTELANTVQGVHGQGVVHADITPKNILLPFRASPVLIDFGNGGFVQERAPIETKEESMTRGTAGYVAPEYVSNPHAPLTPKGDVYSLGVVLYEILTGEKPFDASKPAHTILLDTYMREPKAPRELNPELSPALSNVCLQALAKDPAERVRSAATLAHLVTEVLAEERPPVYRGVEYRDVAYQSG